LTTDYTDNANKKVIVSPFPIRDIRVIRGRKIPPEFCPRPDRCHNIRMSKLTHTLKEEFLAMIPPTIYFFVAFHLVALIHSLMLKDTGVSPLTSVSIAVAALILGKSVLIADMLPLINRFPNKPLIYNIVWKAVIYEMVAIAVHYLEHLIEFWRKAGSFSAANQKLFAEVVWPHFWAIHIVLTLLILAYCTVHELARVIGRENVMRMFFGELPFTISSK
jgi:hypothetical protein